MHLFTHDCFHTDTAFPQVRRPRKACQIRKDLSSAVPKGSSRSECQSVYILRLLACLLVCLLACVRAVVCACIYTCFCRCVLFACITRFPFCAHARTQELHIHEHSGSDIHTNAYLSKARTHLNIHMPAHTDCTFVSNWALTHMQKETLTLCVHAPQVPLTQTWRKTKKKTKTPCNQRHLQGRQQQLRRALLCPD